MKQLLQMWSKCVQVVVISERIIYFSSHLQGSNSKTYWVSRHFS